MAQSNRRSLPILQGTLETAGPWGAKAVQQNMRVYPYHRGAYSNGGSTSTTAPTHGTGEFRVNDYVMACARTAYGNGFLYIPQTSSISRVSAISSSDDELTLTAALSLMDGDYLLNLGSDGATAPTSSPNYDGSRIDLFEDPVGNSTLGSDYLLTGSQGQYNGFLSPHARVVDLLIASISGVPSVVIPGVPATLPDPSGFSATADTTITAAAEATILGSAFGKKTITGNSLRVGDRIRIRCRGFYTSTGTPGTAIFKIKLGSTTIVTSATVTVPASQTDQMWELDADLVCRSVGATGTVVAFGRIFFAHATGTSSQHGGIATTAAQTVDLTSDLDVNVTLTPSVATGSVKCSMTEINVVRA